MVQQAVRLLLEPIFEQRFAELKLFSLEVAKAEVISLHKGVKH
jgi:hypothetical protein